MWKPFGICALLAIRVVSAGTVTFVDTEFNLADYTITSGTNGTYTTTLTQALVGNPGNALLFTLSGVSDLPMYAFYALLNNSFLYDPSISGAIASLDFSVDRYADNKGEFTLSSLSANLLLSQGGNYYRALISGAAVEQTWVTRSGTVNSLDFSLFNPLTGTFDTSLHPDFSLSVGLIQFGVLQRFASNATVSDYVVPIPIEFRHDNYILSIHAVPEAATVGMYVLGLSVFAWMAHRRLRYEGWHLKARS